MFYVYIVFVIMQRMQPKIKNDPYMLYL